MQRSSTLGSIRPAPDLVNWVIAILLLLPCAHSALAQMPGQKLPGLAPVSAEQSQQGIHATMGSEVLDIVVCSDSVIHVVARANAAVETGRKPWMLDPGQSCPGAPFQFAHNAKADTLKTALLEVTFSLDRGNVSFGTASGAPLAREGNSLPRSYEPMQVNGENTFRITDRFSPTPTEAFYGLGQHQSGMFNYRGSTIELGQNNTDVAIPLLISNLGYALMWNTAALTYVQQSLSDGTHIFRSRRTFG